MSIILFRFRCKNCNSRNEREWSQRMTKREKGRERKEKNKRVKKERM